MEQKLPSPTEEEIRAVLKKIGKALPNHNLDCRACGYPTCRDKAIAVVQDWLKKSIACPICSVRARRYTNSLKIPSRASGFTSGA